ncbi:MAG: FtsH protease activity modulator HflK [Treponema sp.]|nr:FtsH protease activity modulator HflK [Treponema sp.]
MAEEQKVKKIRKLKGKSIFLIIVLAIVAAGGLSGFYIVDETEQAVITRFGKYVDTVNPGVHLKLPFGIEKNYNVPVTSLLSKQYGFRTIKQGRNSEYKNNITEESTMLTGDLNLVNVEWTIHYQIENPKNWLFSVQERENTIDDVSRSVINTLIGDRAILDVIGKARTPIREDAIRMMNENFERLQLGIKVTDVQLQNIVAPDVVQEAFEDVNKAIQDMNRYINEGKETYNAEYPRAKGEADRQVQIAEGYASERINRAKGDVAKFNAVYDEYRRAPKVTRERIYLETMEEIFGSNVKPELIDSELKNVLPVKTLTGGNN